MGNDPQEVVRSLTRLNSPPQVSYFEIYLDKIRDLLDGETKLFIVT